MGLLAQSEHPGRRSQSGSLRRARECGAAVRQWKRRPCPPGARGRHRQRRRRQDFTACLARIVRFAAALGRPRRVRPTVAAICRRFRALGSVARRAGHPDAPGRAAGGRRLRRPDRQTQRRACAADREPARGVTKAGAGPSRSGLADGRRQRRGHASGRCAGAVAQAQVSAGAATSGKDTQRARAFGRAGSRRRRRLLDSIARIAAMAERPQGVRGSRR